jgi:hypothetical protein
LEYPHGDFETRETFDFLRIALLGRGRFARLYEGKVAMGLTAPIPMGILPAQKKINEDQSTIMSGREGE